MATAKISDKFQVVIPKLIREKINLHKGQRLYIYAAGNTVVFTPAKKWPSDYAGTEEGLWENFAINDYLEEERRSW